MDRAALEKVYGAFQDFHTYNLVCTFSAFQEFRMVLSWRNKVAGVVAVAALAVALLSAACTAPELIPAPTTASELAVPTAPPPDAADPSPTATAIPAAFAWLRHPRRLRSQRRPQPRCPLPLTRLRRNRPCFRRKLPNLRDYPRSRPWRPMARHRRRYRRAPSPPNTVRGWTPDTCPGDGSQKFALGGRRCERNRTGQLSC